MKPRISMLTLGVRDLARPIAFHEQGLDLPRRESPPSGGFFMLNGTWLGLFRGGYRGYFADPYGYLWEIARNPFMWVGPADD